MTLRLALARCSLRVLEQIPDVDAALQEKATWG